MGMDINTYKCEEARIVVRSNALIRGGVSRNRVLDNLRNERRQSSNRAYSSLFVIYRDIYGK